MINALNLKLQVIITSFRFLKKPTQTYFLECKMLLIKYFRNTKAVDLETHESFSEDHLHKTPTAGNGRWTEAPARRSHPGMSARPLQLSRWPRLLVQAHGWTLVHAHVGITKKSACTALDSSGVQGMQILRRHLQVFSHLWAGRHLRNVEAVLTSIPIRHAVKEEPGRIILSILHKSNIVACFYAENSK